MDETISTTSEVSTEQTTPDVEVSQTQPDEQTTEDTQQQEPADVATDETEIKEQEPTKNWEQIAKDNQASFTRVSQELAQLKKQMQAQQEPKYVDDKGKITPEYEQQYRFNVDNQEFLTYDSLARQLPNEQRNQVEQLLNEAKTLYNPQNKRAYEQKLTEIKNYFSSDIIEQIAMNKSKMESQMQAEFDKLTFEHKQQRSREVAELVEQSDDLKALLYQESENYSPEVFGIVKQMFDLTGGIDLDSVSNAITKIKALGVKEYQAQQKLEAQKKQASVPSGESVQSPNASTLTRAYALANYEQAVKKYGSKKVDETIMKG
jgi:hypothetical protein